MKMYGKAESVAQGILDAFRNGDITEPMANVFLTLKSGRHSASWSLRNQFIMFLKGHSDARGYGQWKEVNRNVKKGEKSFQILAPVFAKKKDRKGEEKGFPVGFRSVNVFGLEQTEGEPLEGQGELENWIANLPLVEVAKEWGISIGAVNGLVAALGALGSCSKDGKRIGLAVKNLSTWAHELIHAADIRLGNLTEKGQHWRSETVAELGGCILLECLGLEQESDRGGCFQYIQRYAQDTGKTAQEACMAALNRTLAAVNLLLETAEKVQTGKAEAVEAVEAVAA